MFFLVSVINLWVILLLGVDHAGCNFIEINKYKQLTLLHLRNSNSYTPSVRISIIATEHNTLYNAMDS
jgi:hypothetical protein